MKYAEILTEALDFRLTTTDVEKTLRDGYPQIAAELPPFDSWKKLEDSDAWFSGFHSGSNKAFDLPFYPDDFIYSPKIELPIPPNASGHAHYTRGIKKYSNMLNKGQTLPPITIVCCLRDKGKWFRLDGNHRWVASVQTGAKTIPAIFAFPKSLLKKTSRISDI